MASMMEILEHCRLCLVKEQVNIPIFEELGDIRQIFLKITACLPVKVDREDNLPKKICDGCLYKLDLLYEFWNTATNAEKQLLSWLDAAGLESKAKIDEEIVVSPTEIVLKEEPITDLPNDISNDISIDISKEIKNDPPKDQNFMHQELPFEPVDFAYGTDTTYQDVPETITTATELVPSEGEPEPKRPRRAAVAAASAAAIAAAELANSESEEDVDDPADQAVTKTEDESEEEEEDEEEDENDEDPDMAEVEPAFVDVSQEANPDAQPGPSGIGKTGDAQQTYQENIFSINFGIPDNMECTDLNMQSKYLLMLVNSKPLPEVTLLENPVDQLNDTDADILNLLAAEENCTAILQNIASNEQFVGLISNETEFPTAGNLNFIDSPYCDKLSYNLPTLVAKPVEPQISKPVGEFKCAECDKVCTTKKLLRYHLTTHSNFRPHSCDICSKSFKQRYKLTAHLRTHEKPSFQCDVCSKMFMHNSQLNSHRKKHSGEFVAFCESCNKGFFTTASHKLHMKVHHENVVHVCDVCGQKLSSMSALNEHKITHRPNYGKQKNHMCEICGKVYLNSRNLKTHSKTHLGIRNYVCNICGKALSSKTILETHVRTHIGKKDFACGYCDKSFAAKEYLNTHLRTHTGDKPFQCPICDKSFTQRTTLTVHLRYHSGERPFKCHCGKSFITKSHLTGHYKTHEVPALEFAYVAQ